MDAERIQKKWLWQDGEVVHQLKPAWSLYDYNEINFKICNKKKKT